jgi:hypothetical protein
MIALVKKNARERITIDDRLDEPPPVGERPYRFTLKTRG